MRKAYIKPGKWCRVTFEHLDEPATEVSVCGEFNEWDPSKHPLKKRRDGRFTATVMLLAGQRYRFRYLVDGTRWENDHAADEYVRNEFGEDDSVVVV